jgi:hypothetical protein
LNGLRHLDFIVAEFLARASARNENVYMAEYLNRPPNDSRIAA